MSVLDEASLVLIPSGYKSGKLYSQVPVPSYGAELVVNGDFATDTSSWTPKNGNTTLYSVSGELKVRTLSDSGYASQSITTVIGSVYKLQVTLRTLDNSANITVGTSNGAIDLATYSTGSTIDETKILHFTATTTTTYVTLGNRLNIYNTFSYFDNASVKEVLVAAADLDFTRSTTGTRVNPDGLIEDVSWNLVTYSEEFDNAAWNKTRSSIIADTEVSPSGVSDADTLTATVTGTNGSWTRKVLSSLTGDYVLSIFAKENTSPYLQLRLDGVGGVVFDLSDGTIKQETGAIGAVSSYDNGWYRCSILVSASSSTTVLYIVGNSSMTTASWASTNGDSCYIWGGQLNVGTTVKTYLPTQGSLVNFPRIDYTNGCGQLLLEPQRSNLITQSEAFSNSYWTKSGASIQGDASTAGSEQVTNGDFATDSDWTKGTGWTISGGLLNATSTAVVSIASQSSVLEIGKFYKIVYTVSNWVGTLTAGIDQGTFDFGNNGYISANGTYTIYGKAEETILRFFSRAENTFSIDNVSVKEVQGFASPSADSPTGAFKLVEDTSTGNHRIQVQKTGSSSGSDYTYSFYVKKGGVDKVMMSDVSKVAFDLTNGTVLYESSNANAKIEAISNDWYRISYKNTLASTNNWLNLYLLPDDYVSGVPTSSYTGDGTSGLYIFGAGLELGSYPTSYIPTSGTSVTRTADSSVINTTIPSGDNGTLFFIISDLIGIDGNEVIFDAYDNNVRKISIRSVNDADQSPKIRLLDDSGFFSPGIDLNVSGNNKISIAWVGTTELVIYVNGVSISPNNLFGSTFTIDKFNFKTADGSTYKLSQFYQSNDRLTDTQLADLTTL